ncbi:MAG: helix-turn-helix domain-containing protein [Propionibacteriales bacterium]|nr:helix-turn-helix domain-containing protein [Propionibacteriales bacterium]
MAETPPRFLPLADVAEILNISVAQVYALVRRGELPAIKIGGRGQWRVETQALEGYIKTAYSTTRQFIRDHPYVGDDTPSDDTPGDDATRADAETVPE